MKTVIGIAGVKTSGKSTVTNMIKAAIKDSSESALAGKLKDVCAEVFGLTREHFDLQELKEVPFDTPKRLDAISIINVLKGFNVDVTEELMNKYKPILNMELETPRRIAQVIGTEVLRATGDEDIHCKNMPLKENGVTIVSDLRFPNEFNYFSKLEDVKFIPLYLNRQEAEKHITKNSHPSETSVFLFSDKCIEIDNNGYIEDTRKQVLAALKEAGVL